MSGNEVVVTLWFVSVTNPAEVLRAEPRADRGFGRKLLAQMNPTWPITPIGQFPLNRSAGVSTGEFYIGGYHGVTVIQTLIDDITELSTIDPTLLEARPAPDVYVIGTGTESSFGGFAHFSGGVLKRSFCAFRDHVIEDIGLPEPFEGSFWAGEHDDDHLGGINLPFHPAELAHSAQTHWIGIDVGPDGPDIQVVGYAIDGRPEPRLDEPKQGSGEDEPGSQVEVYDDYEVDTRGRGDEFTQLADATNAAAKRVYRDTRSRLGAWWKTVDRKLRHLDK